MDTSQKDAVARDAQQRMMHEIDENSIAAAATRIAAAIGDGSMTLDPAIRGNPLSVAEVVAGPRGGEVKSEA